MTVILTNSAIADFLIEQIRDAERMRDEVKERISVAPHDVGEPLRCFYAGYAMALRMAFGQLAADPRSGTALAHGPGCPCTACIAGNESCSHRMSEPIRTGDANPCSNATGDA